MKALPAVTVQPDFLPFNGGLDLVTQQTSRAPGTLGDCLNYEPDLDGGYKRIMGYEAYDGRASPSASVPLPVACTLTLTPAAGTLLTIGGTTGTFIKTITGGMLLADASGNVPGSTAITGTGAAGTTDADSWPAYEVTPAQRAQWFVDCADYKRTLIGAVPGSGPVRGVWIYGANTYAFRDNVGATACVMHKATSGGWTAISFGEEVAFTNAAATVGVGDTLSQGAGPTVSTIMAVVVQSGSLASGINSGRLIISGRSGGVYAAGVATATGGAGNITLGGASTAITLPAGGRYRFRNWNFFGQSGTQRMYFVNGVGRASEFDGTTLVPISTGLSLSLDKPAHLEVNRNYLWLAIGSSVLYSAPGTPTSFDAVILAGEIAVGADVTALQAMPGKALGIFTRNTTSAIFGSSKIDFNLDNIAPESGSIAGVVGVMNSTYSLDDRGIMDVAASQNYGSFSYSTVSRKIQPLLNSVKLLAITSVIVPSKDQWRVMLNDGRVLVMYPRTMKAPEFTLLQYAMTPYSACCMEDSTGTERHFVGASTGGFVYEMEKGSTFNGAAIESYLKTNYYNAKSPRLDKTFRHGLLEMTSGLYANLSYYADFNYSAVGVSQTSGSQEVVGTGSLWDVSAWDSLLWDAPNTASTRLRIPGTGANISLMFYSNTKLDFGHALQGVTLFYTPRKINFG